MHGLAGIEGKDGNPLNEVRVLCNSLLLNNGKVQIEKLLGWPMSAGGALKLLREKSVLGYQTGDDVRLTEVDFNRLADAFFVELRERYLQVDPD